MSKFQSPLLNFGEAVFVEPNGIWAFGWDGRRRQMNILLTVKRRPEALKWDRQLHDAMNFVPWLIDGPHAKPEAGWTPTL